MIMTIIAWVIFSFTVIQLMFAITNLISGPNLPESDGESDDIVSVLIPARNEENNIGNLLDDLIKQVYRNIEIIVFNDQSDDLTAEIVTEYTNRDGRIRLVNSEGLPRGWLGKNFSCYSLSRNPKGKYLLFLDADVRVGGNLIGKAVSFSRKYDLGLISIFPKQKIVTFGEMITVPNMNFILVSLLPLILVHTSKYPSLSAANGQFMFFRTGHYRLLEPHKKMKNDKVEDISIARYYKENGIKTACMLGDDSISCRMYNGFSKSVSGFSKNVIAFFGNSYIAAVLFWLITTFGFIPVYYEFPLMLFVAYLFIYLSVRIIISAVSRQNIILNLLLIVPLQFSLGLFIIKAFTYKYFTRFQWKGRNID